MKIKRLLVLFAAFLLLFASCNRNTDASEPAEDMEFSSGNMIMADFSSDSDNGYVWELDQENDLFSEEIDFIVEEEDESAGDVQRFFLVPLSEGNEKLSFMYIDADGKKTQYTYECTVDKELNITIDNSSGEFDGSSATPPELSILPIDY